MVVAGRRVIGIFFLAVLVGCGGNSNQPEFQFKYVDLSACQTTTVSAARRSLDDSRLQGPVEVAEVLAGTSDFAGTRFNVKGIIQLRNNDAKSTLPEKVDIPINSLFKRIVLLHGACFWATDDVPIAVIRLKYQNGTETVLPIRYGKHVRDWFQSRNDPAPDSGTEIAWTAKNPVGKGWRDKLRIYRTIYDNPIPTQKIDTIEYESTLSSCSPFLLALTLEQ